MANEESSAAGEATSVGSLTIRAGEMSAAFERARRELAEECAGPRLWDKDPTLFTDAAEQAAAIRNRLGWLSAPAWAQERLGAMRDFAANVHADGLTQTVLLGMGGSSLFPDVLSQAFADVAAQRGTSLSVLDNTDPEAVAAVADELDPEHTLFVVASKSGTTIEVASFEAYFWEKMQQRLGPGTRRSAASHFAAITDAGSPLAARAAERRYRGLFLNPQDIGGRYSALSYFGLIPGALLGIDLDALVGAGAEMLARCGAGILPTDNPGLQLGALLGACARGGRDKLTLVLSPAIASLGAWIEQLVAESTGKQGHGIVPVDGESLGPPTLYGLDRVFVHLRLSTAGLRHSNDELIDALALDQHPVARIDLRAPTDLGAELVRFEIATAFAGALLGVNPFDEPNVTEAKRATQALLEGGSEEREREAPGCEPDDLRIREHLRSGGTGSYVALCSYFRQTEPRDAALHAIRTSIRGLTGLATTTGYGPRFLHSTGQLHKGGPNSGVFLQLVGEPRTDEPIPGRTFTFAELQAAQALGDYQVLAHRGRRVLRVPLGADIERGLATLAATLSA